MKAIFKRSAKIDESAKCLSMGTASAAFQNRDLDEETVTIVKLVHYLFFNLDRQMIAVLERRLGSGEPQKRSIRRLIGRIAERVPSLSECLRSIDPKPHHTKYRIFSRVCEISAECDRYEEGFIRRLVSLGKTMGVSENEILGCIERAGLAE